MAAKYKDIQEFLDDCDMKEDIELSYHGIGYGILAWYEEGPLAYRKDEYGYEEHIFPNPESLLDGFIIDGKTLRSIITDIEEG